MKTATDQERLPTGPIVLELFSSNLERSSTAIWADGIVVERTNAIWMRT